MRQDIRDVRTFAEQSHKETRQELVEVKTALEQSIKENRQEINAGRLYAEQSHKEMMFHLIDVRERLANIEGRLGAPTPRMSGVSPPLEAPAEEPSAASPARPPHYLIPELRKLLVNCFCTSAISTRIGSAHDQSPRRKLIPLRANLRRLHQQREADRQRTHLNAARDQQGPQEFVPVIGDRHDAESQQGRSRDRQRRHATRPAANWRHRCEPPLPVPLALA